MTDLKITEAGTVQFPMVRHAAEVGWTPLSPKEALAMRGGEAGLLFQGELEGALRRFNPWMTDNAVRSVVENLQALPPTIEGNREMLAWLRGSGSGTTRLNSATGPSGSSTSRRPAPTSFTSLGNGS